MKMGKKASHNFISKNPNNMVKQDFKQLAKSQQRLSTMLKKLERKNE